MPAVADLRLVQTCFACPEQYDVFDGERQVGYLRLRHGHFTAEYLQPGGTLLYQAKTHGDGIFEDEAERRLHLGLALEAISRREDNVDFHQFSPEGVMPPPPECDTCHRPSHDSVHVGWDTYTLQMDYEVEGFQAPYVVVTRKSDGKRGSLRFTHRPRWYYDFTEHRG